MENTNFKTAYHFEDCNIKNAYCANWISNVDGINKILGDFCALKHLKTPTSEFELYAAKQLQQKTLTEADSASLTYINYPFNDQGFRSIAFDNIEEKKSFLIFFTITPDESIDYNKNKSPLAYDTLVIDQIFKDLPYYIPSNLLKSDYNQPKDIHFSTVGSLKYASFIDSLIKIK